MHCIRFSGERKLFGFARRGFAMFSLREACLVALLIAGLLCGIDRIQTSLELASSVGPVTAPTVHQLLVDDAADALWIVRRSAGISLCALDTSDVLKHDTFQEEVCQCLLSTDGPSTVSALTRMDGAVEVHRNGRLVVELPAEPVHDLRRGGFNPLLSVTPDGRTVVAVERTGVAHCWTFAGDEPQAAVQKLDTLVDRIDLQGDGRFLAVLSDRQQLRIWDLERQTWLREWQLPHPFCSAVRWSREGMRLATIGSDAQLCVWNASSGTLLWRRDADLMNPCGVEFSPCGNFVVSGGFDNRVRLWNAAHGELVWERAGHRRAPCVFAWSKDSRHVYSSGMDGQVRTWDVPQ